ncbi:hypothetical protein ACMFMF_002202 [Clarireedia jacksonii]
MTHEITNGTGPEQASNDPGNSLVTPPYLRFPPSRAIPPSPPRFLESVEILLEGAPAKKLDSTPRIRNIMDQLEKATQEDMDTVKQWLKDEYPVDVADLPETDLQSEIESFRQNGNESMAAYYQRATQLLRRAHGRDRPTSQFENKLTPIEEVMLNSIINTFVKGLIDPALRREVLARGGTTCGSLAKSYEVIQGVQHAIELAEQSDKDQEAKFKLTRLEELMQRQYGRSAMSVLADLEAGRPLGPSRDRKHLYPYSGAEDEKPKAAAFGSPRPYAPPYETSQLPQAPPKDDAHV